MVTISRVHKGRRIRGSGTTRAHALANLERSIRWVDRLGYLSRVPAAVSNLMKSRPAAQFFRRTRDIQ